MMSRASQTYCPPFAVKAGFLPFYVGIHIVCFPIILELFSDATASFRIRRNAQTGPSKRGLHWLNRLTVNEPRNPKPKFCVCVGKPGREKHQSC